MASDSKMPRMPVSPHGVLQCWSINSQEIAIRGRPKAQPNWRPKILYDACMNHKLDHPHTVNYAGATCTRASVDPHQGITLAVHTRTIRFHLAPSQILSRSHSK